MGWDERYDEYLIEFSEQELAEHDAEIRAEVIDECYMKVKTILDDIRYHQSNKRTGKTCALYCMQALEFLRQVVEQLKEGVKDD